VQTGDLQHDVEDARERAYDSAQIPVEPSTPTESLNPHGEEALYTERVTRFLYKTDSIAVFKSDSTS
jgi:hypothetical protein